MKAEGSSATDSVTDVTDVTDVRKKEEGRRKNYLYFSLFLFSFFSLYFFPPQARQSLWISIPGQSLEVNI